MTDRTEAEAIRRVMTQSINAVEGSREFLEAKHGQVWDTSELQQEFEVLGFCSPCCVVRNRSNSQRGTVFFQHNPRFYFGFEPE
ncbi:MAG: hypothetical protein CME32_31680 [Gimesia sp.]|uniref:Uncharacterized protein n=1 Tax=Gimesia chilikensis TaxID=2605989 RepID=A0A517PKI0_9PLAN|nr:hypothetical protein [Gimesia chilikensis]MBN73841.1 hypothetical protein [Gimesia sp.]QDT19886.1 hypothetical protein HG66A1_16540 [Gimesia chilikensis]